MTRQERGEWKVLGILASEGRRLLYFYNMMVEGESTVTSAGQEQEGSKE